jgi:chromosomal replication initiator protein
MTREITMLEIVTILSELYAVPIASIRGPRRNRPVIDIRHIAIYLARTHTSHSLPAIGRFFGGRHHTSIMHSISKIERQSRRDANLKLFLDSLEFPPRLCGKLTALPGDCPPPVS